MYYITGKTFYADIQNIWSLAIFVSNSVLKHSGENMPWAVLRCPGYLNPNNYIDKGKLDEATKTISKF